MMEKRRLPQADFPAFILGLPFAVDVNTRYLDLPTSNDRPDRARTPAGQCPAP
jgi:hypothetical protein